MSIYIYIYHWEFDLSRHEGSSMLEGITTKPILLKQVHSCYCSFASLKWFRKVYVHHAFVINEQGFRWGRQLEIFADHWQTNDLKIAGHKLITIIYFFLSEIIFREKMVSVSSNNRFDNDKIFLPNIWDFSVITEIVFLFFFFFFVFIIKMHERTL